MSNIKKYTLFYPSQELGGAELLMSRLADKLAELGHEVTIIDSEKKVISRNSVIAGVRKVILENKTKILVNADYLIAFASHINNLGEYVHPNKECKVFFWSIHPLNSIYLIPQYGERLFQINFTAFRLINKLFFRNEDVVRKRAISALLKENAFACMDAENSRVVAKYYGINDDFNYLPVPVDVPASVDLGGEQNALGAVIITWYGRLCDFKVHALEYLIYELTKIKYKYKFKLIIIGDGPLRFLIEKAVDFSGISAEFKGRMENHEAKDCISREADVVFAMGTAALEAATMGIPTVLADASYRKINFPYKFRWLYKTKKFTLGRFIDKSTPIEGQSISEIIDDLYARRCVHAKACFDYVKENHEISEVVALVEKKCHQSTMSLEKFIKLTTYQRPLIICIYKFLRKFKNIV